MGLYLTVEEIMSAPIHHEVAFPAPPSRIFEVLMDSGEHAAFTANGAAEISREAGGAFSTHDGQIVGRNIEILPDKRIVQAWRVSNWPDGVYSLVRFELDAEGDGTKLVFDHWGFPEGSRDHLDSGWTARYWEPLGKYLE
jgi:activator of HSP90 ATPase